MLQVKKGTQHTRNTAEKIKIIINYNFDMVFTIQNTNPKKRCNLGIHNNAIPLILNIIQLFSLKIVEQISSKNIREGGASTNHVDHFLGFLTIWIEILLLLTYLGFIRLYNFPPSP